MVNLKDHKAIIQDVDILAGVEQVSIRTLALELLKRYQITFKVEILLPDVRIFQRLAKGLVQEGVVVVKDGVFVAAPALQEFQHAFLQELHRRR